MLKELQLIGFKSFLSRSVPLSNLTLLTGVNSSGKSSVIQAILILQKAFHNEKQILLEGHGSAEEIRNQYFREEISLTIGADDRSAMVCKIALDKSNNYKNIHTEIPFNFPEVIHISANRYGPKTSIPIYTDLRKDRLGPNGENVLQCIRELGGTNLDELLRHESSEGVTFEFNIKGWLSVISPGVKLDYSISDQSDSSFSTFNGHRANNVGCGLSYSLPVIAALLMGTFIPNSLVIIENPEAHLHPRGQRQMADLIAKCVEVGAQVIVETHSDHIFDGIRIAAKKMKGFSDKVQVNWFQLNDKGNTEVVSPILSKSGRLDEWPQGLFDQFEISALELL